MSTFTRLATLESNIHTAEKWIQKAVKHPGRVYKLLGIEEGEDIPEAKIDDAIAKLKAKDTRSEKEQGDLKALQLAKRFQSM